jgi:hypothetical protein
VAAGTAAMARESHQVETNGRKIMRGARNIVAIVILAASLAGCVYGGGFGHRYGGGYGYGGGYNGGGYNGGGYNGGYHHQHYGY